METVELHVYRDLSNRVAGEPDDGPMARRAHRLRAEALHEELKDFDVIDWGATDDKQTHELVSLVVGFIKSPEGQAVLVPALTFMGSILSESLKSVVVDGVKALVTRIVGRMRGPTKSIQDGLLVLPDGSRLRVAPDATLQLTLKSGKLWSLHYDASEQDVTAAAKNVRTDEGVTP